jgi:hypothetical protein
MDRQALANTIAKVDLSTHAVMNLPQNIVLRLEIALFAVTPNGSQRVPR